MENEISKSIVSQLYLMGNPEEMKQHMELFSIDKLNSFVDRYTSEMINKFGINKVQNSIDADNNPHDPILSYITCIMELGILHELFHQSYASSDEDILRKRLIFIVRSINIAVATNLKAKGLKRIPSLHMGEINIYYSWENMAQILGRILPVASQMKDAVPNEIQTYIDNLIIEKLK